MSKRLYRSQTNKVLGGVCGGLADYLDLDPVLVRILFVILALANGIGVLLYFLLWIVIPSSEFASATAGNAPLGERVQNMSYELRDSMRGNSKQAPIWIGGALILAGVILLANSLNIWWLRWIRFDTLWPLLLILAGLFLLTRVAVHREPVHPAPLSTESSVLNVPQSASIPTEETHESDTITTPPAP